MRLVVLGSGKMGKAIAWVLVRGAGTAAVTVADADLARARALGESLGFAHATADFADDAQVRVTVEGGERGHSAMMRTTGYPAAVIALMLADGRITKRGVVPGELCVPVDDLVRELAALGLPIETRRENVPGAS